MWLASTIIGLTGAFTVAYYDSENRLQGYLPNDNDAVYWKQRAEHERKLARGELETDTSTMTQQTLYWLFGPKSFNSQQLEEEYLGVKRERH